MKKILIGTFFLFFLTTKITPASKKGKIYKKHESYTLQSSNPSWHAGTLQEWKNFLKEHGYENPGLAVLFLKIKPDFTITQIEKTFSNK